MVKPTQPAEIAREAIRLLAMRRQPPTPDHFRRAYNEVAGQRALPADAAARQEGPSEIHWAEVLRPLFRQWDIHQSGLTQARKREMLERVLINFGHQGPLLQQKLGALARSWAESAPAGMVLGEDGAGIPEATPVHSRLSGVTDPDGDEGRMRCMAALAVHLRQLASSCEPYWPELSQRAAALGHELATTRHLQPRQLEAWSRLWREILMRSEDSQVLSAGLKRLMGLLFLNIGELVGDEAWLSGQLAAMRNLMAAELQADTLLEAERGLRDLTRKQGAIKAGLDEARDRLKALITTFVDHLSEMSRSTDGYRSRIGGYSTRIRQASDLDELDDVVRGLTMDVSALRDALGRSHAELESARAEAEQAQARIHALEQELIQASGLMREDQLTGALNRRGMDEALARELARSQRMHTSLSLGLLDIDHFKRLNDRLGHQVGDEALRHLAGVVKAMLRPTDILARYGGEEFLILLPNTRAEEAAEVLRRVQRALTKKFFLHDNERLLITFSAGVVERGDEDEGRDLIARADAAMYRAKQSGRNRVEVG
ncbi:MAG TPA: GGDEF domain-containing protein [Thiobacillaceae bacterium]|nr:GGDEF domain-containing protein [Thiobacillaceae bacterium]HNU62970.1 GGDEF domain-containing protein [Thiobacillaceae bacterium]